jgi:hypothetical protein
MRKGKLRKIDEEDPDIPPPFRIGCGLTKIGYVAR